MSRYRPAEYVSFFVVRSANGTNSARIGSPAGDSAPRLSFWPLSVNSSVPTICICRSCPLMSAIQRPGEHPESFSSAGTA